MVRSRCTRRSPLDVESLERRDCPAALVGVVGGGTIAEGGESAMLTVVLSEPQRRPVQVGYVVTGDGVTQPVTPGDYRLSVGAKGLDSRSGTIQFRPGETIKQVRVSSVDDAVREGTESLRFSLFRPKGCTVDTDYSAVDLAVGDNDDYMATIVPVGSSRISEGESATFAIQLSKPATTAETYYVSTQDGSASSEDYRPLRDMPVTILAGQSRSTPFTLSTLADSDSTETDEYFLVSARPRSQGMPAVDPVGVTIIGTGPAPLSISVTDVTAPEGNSGTRPATLTVRLGAPALEPVVVQYATSDGTATSGVDYVAATGSITFARGEISKALTVQVIGDSITEENEAFQLVVSAVSANTTPVVASGTVSIQDDDSAFDITIDYLTPMQPEWKAAVERAVNKWESIIVGDVPDEVYEGRRIDDFEIRVSFQTLAPDDLGYARTLQTRQGAAGLPFLGEMVMNTTYANFPGIYDTIVHELAHALGFNPAMWASLNLNGGTAQDPRFLGTQATQAFNEVFRRSDIGVPLYEVGKPNDGSYGTHWRSSIFGFEAMVHAGDPKVTGAPVSRITVGHFADIGYRVNFLAADPYRPFGTGRETSAAFAMNDLLQQQRSRSTVRVRSVSVR